MRPRLALCVVALGFFAGCTDELAPAVELELAGRASAAIKDGYDDPDSTAVMAVTNLSSGGLCSGSLIAPNVILTARHCVSSTSNPNNVSCATTTFGQPHGAPSFFVSSAEEISVGNAGEFLVDAVVGLAGIPGIPGSVSDDLTFCGNDIAILILAENVPPEVAVPLVPSLEGDRTEGLPYYAVGYGAVNGQGEDAGRRRRRDDLSVLCDDESGCVAIELTDVVDGEWAGTGGVCSGDSGGPALDLEDRVIGVTSRGDSACELSVYGDPVAHAQWIKDATVFASGMGLYDAPSWTAGASVVPEHSMPVGDVCEADSDCPTGICVKEDTRQYCSRPCTEVGPCPEGYACSTDPEPICRQVVPPAPPAFERAPRDGCAVVSPADGPLRGAWLVALGAVLLRRRRRP